MPRENQDRIYSATYSNVPVYEFNVDGNHVMRRRVDDWINATHILKVADFDKPARTRILEREVQKNVHEKVQGGYGKYQGTWVPLMDGRALAERNGVLNKLLPIFEFVHGERSPPPAPKHATGNSGKPKTSRTAQPSRKYPGAREAREDHFEIPTSQLNEDDGLENATVASESLLDEPETTVNSQYPPGSRKRKRSDERLSLQDQQHQLWADALLDYFMLLESEDRFPAPPEPPSNIDLDRAIDDQGHSAMHWAASMGDVDIVKDLISRGASIDCVSGNHETPLMRAVMFTNNFDKKTMPKLIQLLENSVSKVDFFGSTVFHHIAATTSSRSKYLPARYYLDCIINKLNETWAVDDITRLLNAQDQNGDTAIMIAARNGARKCVRSLLGRNAAVDVPNRFGETADELIRDLNSRRRERLRQLSSSPFRSDMRLTEGSVAPIPSDVYHPDMQHFCSGTANTLKEKVLPSFLDKVEQLTAAFESEVGEKEREFAEIERVIQKRQAETEAFRKEAAELAARKAALAIDGGEEGELDAYFAESGGLSEISQRGELGRLVREWEGRVNSNPHQSNMGQTFSVEEKKRQVTALYEAQAERKDLVLEITQAQRAAGIGERQLEYKRLIMGALGIKEDEVDGMLKDILEELEEAKECGKIETSPFASIALAGSGLAV